MKKLSTYLLVIFMIMFWILRIIITLKADLGSDFMGLVPIDRTMEMVLLFLTLLCIVLVVKRKLVGALLYVVMYAIYFGGDITNKLNMMANSEQLTIVQSTELFYSVLGVALSIAVLLDLILDKNRKLNPKDKKTDWFYKNEDYDRKYDERADKNNYRTQ